MNYRGDFLIGHEDKIQGKVVLEVAAGAGYVSENIIELQPAKFFMTDYQGSGTFRYNPFKDKPNVYTPVIDILHDLPDFYKNNTVDTVICAGYLYHTAHPAWAIEQMLIGRPKWFYLETNSGDKIGNYDVGANGYEELDANGNHSSYPGAMPYQLCLHETIIEQMVISLNYKISNTLTDKLIRSLLYKERTPDFEKYPLGEGGEGYYDFWKGTTGWWFERND